MCIVWSACSAHTDDLGGPATAGATGGAGEAGLGPWSCPAGELEEAAGCRPAGIAPEECGAGFVADGMRGCEPILPPAACPKGMMAVPGDAACRPVADCGPGKWDGIPTAVGTQFVDASAQGLADGTAAKPWPTIAQALAAASPGVVVAIAPGTYAEPLTLTKPVALWGKCPAEVTIAPANGVGLDAALAVGPGAGGSEVHRVAIAGPGTGVAITGAKDVLIDAVWIHDTGYHAVSVCRAACDQPLPAGGGLPTGVRIRGALIENAYGIAVLSVSADVAVEASAMRDVSLVAGDFGHAIQSQRVAPGDPPPSLTVTGSLFERLSHLGIVTVAGPAEVRTSVIRDVTLAPVQPLAAGIAALHGGATASLTVDTSLVERCTGYGVFGEASAMAIDHSVIRDVKPGAYAAGVLLGVQAKEPSASVVVRRSLIHDVPSAGVASLGAGVVLEGVAIRTVGATAGADTGYGVYAQSTIQGVAPSVTIRGSRIDGARGFGVILMGADYDLEGVRITRVDAAASMVASGGVQLQPAETLDGAPAMGRIRRCEVDHVAGMGINLAGTHATVDSTWVHDVAPAAQAIGRGIAAQRGNSAAGTTSAALSRLLIEDVSDVGILVIGVSATIDRAWVRRVAPLGGKGFGDGIAAFTEPAAAKYRAEALVTGSRIESIARAGIGAFGAGVRIATSTVECAAIDLDGETLDLQGAHLPFAFLDEGGNHCGCGGAVHPCKAVSANLSPPDAPP
jgi:hypothetical protein